jgi:hypothetical protein
LDKNVRTQDVLPGDLRQIVRNIVLISKATPGDDEFVLWLAPRLEAAGYTVFADILNLEGGTRLVNDRMRLACGSPSNRSSMKRWTSPEQRVWFRLIVWPRESWLHTRRFAICRLGATRNTNPRRPVVILYFSESPSTLPDSFVSRHKNEGMAETFGANSMAVSTLKPYDGWFVRFLGACRPQSV